MIQIRENIQRLIYLIVVYMVDRYTVIWEISYLH